MREMIRRERWGRGAVKGRCEKIIEQEGRGAEVKGGVCNEGKGRNEGRV